jgi:hypothetical protein
LAVTVNATCPLPCPEVGVIPEIQPAAVDALHPHSCRVVTATVPLPPLAEMLALDSVTSHLAGDGPATIVEVDSQPMALSVAIVASNARRQRIDSGFKEGTVRGLTASAAITPMLAEVGPRA